MVSQARTDGDIVPARHIRCRQDHPVFRIERTGGSNADAQLPLACGEEILNRLDHARDHGFGTFEGQRGKLDRFSCGGLSTGEVGNSQVGRAQVDGDQRGHVRSISWACRLLWAAFIIDG